MAPLFISSFNLRRIYSVENQRVRICDIAQELGLSTATVSNVIHGKTKKISDETVKRVMVLIEERGYLPAMADVLMTQNSSKIIGVFINDHEKYGGHTLEDFFISSSINYLSTEIEKNDQFMMLKKAKSAEEIIKFASMWNMDGIVVVGFCQQDYMNLRNHMRIPFVIYDGVCDKPDRIFNITIDNIDGGRQIGQHFKALGHTKALCIADNNIGIDLERYQGFCQGFEGETSLLVIPMDKEKRWLFYQENLDTLRSVTAVFAVSDYYAIDFMCFLKKEGILVPDELSVAGFDDIPMCEIITPNLTTIKQDGALRAKLAMEKLTQLKNHQLTDTEVTLPVSLVIRNSTHTCQ